MLIYGCFIIIECLELNKMVIDRKIFFIGLVVIVVLILGGIFYIVVLVLLYWYIISVLLFNGKMLCVGNFGLWVECIVIIGVMICGLLVIVDEGKIIWGKLMIFVNIREIIYLVMNI